MKKLKRSESLGLLANESANSTVVGASTVLVPVMELNILVLVYRLVGQRAGANANYGGSWKDSEVQKRDYCYYWSSAVSNHDLIPRFAHARVCLSTNHIHE